LRTRPTADVEHGLGQREQGRRALGQRPGPLASSDAHGADEGLQRILCELQARRTTLAQHVGQLQPAHQQVVEVPEPVADEGVIGWVDDPAQQGAAPLTRPPPGHGGGRTTQIAAPPMTSTTAIAMTMTAPLAPRPGAARDRLEIEV